jgi:beta-xylosidase
VQCTGHGDLVRAADGEWYLAMLGVWVRGSTRAFGSLGRETFLTRVEWHDNWPRIAPVDATERTPLPPFVDDFGGEPLGPEWIAVRRRPSDVARIEGGELVLEGEQRSMDDKVPTFVGRRQTRFQARIAATVRAATPDTVGGLSVRFDEAHHFDIELRPGRVVAARCR